MNRHTTTVPAGNMGTVNITMIRDSPEYKTPTNHISTVTSNTPAVPTHRLTSTSNMETFYLTMFIVPTAGINITCYIRNHNRTGNKPNTTAIEAYEIDSIDLVHESENVYYEISALSHEINVDIVQVTNSTVQDDCTVGIYASREEGKDDRDSSYAEVLIPVPHNDSSSSLHKEYQLVMTSVGTEHMYTPIDQRC